MKPKHTIIAVAVRWFVNAVHRSQKRTQNTASESVASDPKPSNAKPPEDSSVPAPRLDTIKLPDGEAIADSFFFPFLGTVECFSRTREEPYTTRDGETYNWPIKIFYDRNGKFLRAEYVKKGAVDYQAPHWLQEANYKEEKILGVPDHSPPLSVKQIVDLLYKYSGSKMDRATRINISWVLLQSPTLLPITKDGAPPKTRSVFIMNVFGSDTIHHRVPDLPEYEKFRRVRNVFDENGKPLWSDSRI